MLGGRITVQIKDDSLLPKPSDLVWDSDGPVEIEQLSAFVKSKLIEISLLTLREEQAQGFDQKPLTLVDGAQNKPLENVKPFGRVEYVSRVDASEFLLPIYEGLIKRSPVDDGNYVNAHFVYVNQVLVAVNMASLKSYVESNQIKGGDIIRFVDVVPYAGKLERQGITASKRGSGNIREKMSRDRKRGFRSGFTVRAPNGAYYLTAKSILKNFKYNSKIEFQWVNGSNIDLSAAPTTAASGKKFRRTFAPRKGKGARKGSYAYPSIVIIINSEGIL